MLKFIFLMVVVSIGYSSFLPVTEVDQSKLKAIVNTIEMNRLFQRDYDQSVVFVSGPENYRELETVDRPMNGQIPMNVYQDINGSKDRYFSRWNTLSRSDLQDKEFIFTGEGTGGGTRALVLAAYWKEKYEQLTGSTAAPHQIKVITFNADSFGDDIFQRTINRTIEKESILNFYVRKWGDYIPFSGYLKPFFAGSFVYDYMFSREMLYATSVPISMIALSQENYLEIFKHLLGISFCGWITKMVYSCDAQCTFKPGTCSNGGMCAGGSCDVFCKKSDAEYALGATLLPIALLYSAYSCYQYLSHLVPSASIAHKSIKGFGDCKKKN